MASLSLIIILAYLLGSISPSIILSRLVKDVDIRHFGSGNAGMTNAIRVLGPAWGSVVALVDLAKGFCASMVIPLWLGSAIDIMYVDHTLVRILAGTAAVVGHIWTVFFRFKGGKGVLTMAGAALGVAPVEIGLCFAVFVLTFLITRYVSLGSILGAILFPVAVFVERFVFDAPTSPYLLVFSLFAGWLILFTHRANIRRLWRGEEHRFVRRSADAYPESPAESNASS